MPHKDPEVRAAYLRQWKASHPPVSSEDSARYRRTYNDRHPGSALESSRKHDAKPERIAYKRAYKKTDEYREKNRGYKLKSRFGITLQEYYRMLEAQEGKCAMCGSLNPDGRRLFVDHDHATSRVRGLLCVICNRLVAHYEGGLSLKMDCYLGDTVEAPY